MNSKGLRLGNLAQDQDGNLLKVIGLSTDPELENEDIISFYVVDRTKFPLKKGWKAEFIPLTAEILVKFGFEKEGKNHWGNGDLDLFFDGFEFCAMVGTEYDISINYKYVHELQNIYFYLVGGELVFSTEP